MVARIMPPDYSEILLRIGMAFLTGLILGFEREHHGRAAGLRTTVLVCVAAALAAILSDRFYAGSFAGPYQSNNWHPDPARLAAGILTGIGFLGAGVIVRQGNLVRGVTTASQIWFVTILGLCFGSGEITLGLLGVVVSFVTVFFLRYIEVWVQRDWYGTLTVEVSGEGPTTREIAEVLSREDVSVKGLELAEDNRNKRRQISLSVRYKHGRFIDLPERVFSALKVLPGVERVEWK